MEGKDKKAASVQGTGTADQEAVEVKAQTEVKDEPTASETPSWVTDLIKSNDDLIKSNADNIASSERLIASNTEFINSNNEVMASNNALVEAIDRFRNSAGEIAGEVVKQAQSAISGEAPDAKPAVMPTIDEDAKYIVAKGKRCQDRDNPEVYYTEGMDVTHIGEERLVNLLSQGIIEEA